MSLFEEKRIVKYLEDLSKVNDKDYLYKNIHGCCSNDGPFTDVNNGKINEWYYYDNDTNEIKKFTFDSITIAHEHGFGGTSFNLLFSLKGLYVVTFKEAYPTFDELKAKLMNDLCVTKGKIAHNDVYLTH
jgi:hypothetical protein